ncbi:tripartite tricarboxylate transporter TctB family protein [Alkalihalobacillus sp. 1P02AB]|uniref:tripartite tricarboxylate transporter TctB family protein n=1 Tax=Alkalihalobacillus sp. 1P02AB TaxID=3132260 RepID=UPI0039A630EF
MTRLLSGCLFIFGIMAVFLGLYRYDFWTASTPGSGFIPTIGGAILTLCSLIIFMKNTKQKSNLNKRHIYPVIGILIMMGLIQVIGMILSIAIFTAIWLRIVERYPMTRASIYSLTTTGVIYVVFKISLNVPLPQGLIGI